VDSRQTAFRQGVVTVAVDELPASLARRVLEASAAPMILFENRANDCVVLYVNPAFANRIGYSTDEIAQIGWDGIQMDGGREPGLAPLGAAIRDQRELEMPLRIHGKNGVTSRAALHVSPLADQGTTTQRFAVGVLRELTADLEYVSRLERDARYDPLTSLPNRRLLAESAARAIAHATNENQVLAVALIDLDDFKLINDTLGHGAGDEVLCAVGARLARDVRPGDLIARIGGDEFVLLLQEANGFFSLASVIERVTARIKQPIHLHAASITISCSVGISVCPTDGADLNTLLKHADSAMYRQKACQHSMGRGVALSCGTMGRLESD
jgi:diguanylate cyclase (GGDEF)-like protein/PAS domain S-box-containing protein